MKNVLILFENQIIRITFLITLLIYSFSISFLFLNKKEETLIIGIDNNKTFLIESSENKLLQSEEMNFVRYFTTLLYNYDRSTFEANVGKATELMTDKYWIDNKDLILNLHQRVKNQGLAQSSYVYKIIKHKNMNYSVFIESQISFKSNNEIKSKINKYEIKLSLLKTKRSKNNAWAFAVNDIKDERVN
ncbi:MAG: hypothetical protein MK008_09770 [Bdellovibrionales bacterium]|nr:hypothetical protein [Bdellovibrionales bacterium]